MVVIVDEDAVPPATAAVAPPNGETRMFSNSTTTAIIYKTYTDDPHSVAKKEQLLRPQPSIHFHGYDDCYGLFKGNMQGAIKISHTQTECMWVVCNVCKLRGRLVE